MKRINFMSHLPDKHELLADANEDFKWGKPENEKDSYKVIFKLNNE